MKVSVDVHEFYADRSLAEIRTAIIATVAIQRAFASLTVENYRQFTDTFRNIIVVAQVLGAGKISEEAHKHARKVTHAWRRPLLAGNIRPTKLYLSEGDYRAWMAFPVAERNNLLNDYLAIGPILERAVTESSVRVLVEKVWDYWIANPGSEQAWRHISETVEALA